MKGFNSQWYLKRTGIQLAAPKKRKKRKKRGPSLLETKFEWLWNQNSNANFCQFVKEHRFHPKRRYRFDFAWPLEKVALEIDGGIFLKKGGHTSGTGKRRDAHKDWLATQFGWRIIRWTPDMVTAENCKLLCTLILMWTTKDVRFFTLLDSI